MRISVNNTGQVRREEIDGTEYLVAPTTFIKSMNLHRGYVPKREVKDATKRWEGTPIVADHPTDPSGEFVSVNDPSADKTPFGFIDNTETEVDDDAKTQGEIWVNVEKAKELDGLPKAIANDLESGETLAVSSSYGGQRLPSGKYDGQRRDKVIGGLRPDHVAILRNRDGRCSIDDGCMAGAGAVAANSNLGVMVNAMPDDSVSPENGQDEGTGDMETAYNALSEARTPTFSGTTTGSWEAPTFSEYVSAFGWEAEEVGDLSEEQKTQVAEHTLLGDPEADTFAELQVFPVVEPDSENLSENALVAVLGGRGAQADVPDSALESARDVARQLLEDEFDRDMSANAGFLMKLANALGFGREQSGNQDAEGTDNEPETQEPEEPTEDNMSDRTQELVELGFNADNLPDEDTECFNRIYEEFASNEEPDEPDETETEESDEENEEPAVTFDSEEEFEDTVAEIVSDEVDEALAANKERQKKAELADEIIANSDDHDEDDREELLDTPESVLETLKASVSSDEGKPNYMATRSVSANQNEDSDSTPALSVGERLNETEGDD